MFESTIVLSRQELLTWSSAGTLTGTLTVPSGDAFDWQFISQRDRQLARRDLVLANTVADVAAMMMTVWGGKVHYSAPPEPEGVDMPGSALVASDPVGPVSHVVPSSTPDLAYPVDDALLKRDILLLEGLRQVAAMVPDAVISGTLPAPIGLTVAWSLAEGLATDLAINPILPLNVDAVKNPDRAMAERDNQLALNIAQLKQILRNPFLSSTRILLQSVVDPHEAESYVLVYEDNDKKIWQAEPGLEGRMRVLYDKATQTLAWNDENTVAPLYYPQPYAVGGTLSGKAELLPYLDGRKDAEFWRQKALQVNLLEVKENMAFNLATPGLSTIGDVYEDRGSAVFVKPGQITTHISTGTISAGLVRVAMLFTPEAEIVVDGAKAIGGTIDDSAVIFSTSGGTLQWNLKLSPGSWSMAIYYTNLTGTATSLPILIQLGSNVISNLGLKVTQENGVVEHSDYFVTTLSGEEVLSISWAPPDTSNQLKIERIVFKRDSASMAYDITARLGQFTGGGLVNAGGSEHCEVVGYPYRPDTLSFVFLAENDVPDPAIELNWAIPVFGTIASTLGLTPLKINQVEVMAYDWATVTQNADGFDGWPSEMAERAAEAVVESFREGVRVNPTFEPTELLNELNYWTVDSTARWLDMLRTLEPRFDNAFRTGGPGDIGRPSLIPAGVEFDLTNEATSRSVTLEAEVVGTISPPIRAVATLPGTLCYPMMRAYQPWMSLLGLPVMREAFWAESMAQLRLLPVSLLADPTEGGQMTGSGLYAFGQDAIITATPSAVQLLDYGLDLVIVVDESASMADSWAYIPALLTNLDQQLRAIGIGAASVHNRYGLVGQSGKKLSDLPTIYERHDGNCTVYFLGGVGNYWADINPADPSTGLGLITGVASTYLGQDYNYTGADWTTEDAYVGIDWAIRQRTWRSGVAKVILFLTDEDRNYQSYVSAGVEQNYASYLNVDWQAARTNLLAQIAAWGGDVHGAGPCGVVSGVTTAMGRSQPGTAYIHDGIGGYTTLSNAAFSGDFNYSGSDGNGQTYLSSTAKDDYYDMLMTMPSSSYWNYNQFRLGGNPQLAFTKALVDVVKQGIIAQIDWQFDGWYNDDNSLYSASNPTSFQVLRPVSLTARFSNILIHP